MDDRFSLLVDKYQDRVYNQAYRMLGNSEDAEEAAQDVFLRIYRSIDTFPRWKQDNDLDLSYNV